MSGEWVGGWAGGRALDSRAVNRLCADHSLAVEGFARTIWVLAILPAAALPAFGLPPAVLRCAGSCGRCWGALMTCLPGTPSCCW